MRSRRCPSSSRQSSAMLRLPASNAASRSDTPDSTPRLARARLLSTPIGSTAKRSPAVWPCCRTRPIPETSMLLSPDGKQPIGRRLYLAVAVLITAAGYGLTLAIFYPGIVTFDAKFVYEYIAKGVLGDWQSPVMTVLWGVIDPIAPGAGSMFLLIATSYWLGFGLLALALARRSSRLALLLPLLALMPPAFVFVGIIWRDVLFAAGW